MIELKECNSETAAIALEEGVQQRKEGSLDCKKTARFHDL